MKPHDRPRAKVTGAVLAFLLIFACLVGGGYFYLGWARAGQGKRIADLEALSAKLTAETVPMRFMVLSRGDAGIRARIRLYDLSGKELVLLERTFSGRELYFDFLFSLLPPPADGKAKGDSDARWLAFPYRVFTDSLPPAQGLLLLDSYDRSGFPALFDGGVFGADDVPALKAMYARARRAAVSGEPAAGVPAGEAGGALRNSDYGSAVHEVSSLARFDEGVVYKIVCRAKGGIEIMED
jgi:hypothetical protein